MQDSEGPLYDRTTEHLGMSDIAVIRLRKRLLGSVRAFMRGEEPLGVRAPVVYERLGGDEKTIRTEAPWQEVGSVHCCACLSLAHQQLTGRRTRFVQTTGTWLWSAVSQVR